MAEWFKAPVLKTGVGCKLHRGFESLSLRLNNPKWGGARVADWDRLLSGCRVRIPPSPLKQTAAKYSGFLQTRSDAQIMEEQDDTF